MSVFTREHIELLRQYFLSDDSRVKNELLESIPSHLREKVFIIQDEFEKDTDAKSIAAKIGAFGFEEELEEIQSTYLLKKLEMDDLDFEVEIKATITQLERENLKKKLIALEENEEKEPSDLELKSAITQIERKSLKKKFQKLDDSSNGGVIPIHQIEEAAASKIIPIQSILRYAVAACFILAIGVGIYQFTREEAIPENRIASSSEEELSKQEPNGLPVIETLPLAEVSITSSSFPVLKYGLGYGEIEEKVTVVVNNQNDRVLSIQKAISTYSNQIEKLKESQNQETAKVTSDLKNRISSLQAELTQLNNREKQYVFDGKVLNLFVSSVQTKNQIIRFGDGFYLQSNAKFFKLTISKEPQTFLEETDPNVLKALDKIIFNAD